MGFRLSKLKEKTLPLVIKCDENELNITYTPGKYTPDFLDKLQEAQLSGNIKESMVTSILELISSWDFLDENDAILPLTADVMRHVPVTVISAISAAIGADLTAPKLTTTSSEGSFGA